MRKSLRETLKKTLLWLGIIMNSCLLGKQFLWSLSISRRVWHLSLSQKYELLYTPLYQDIKRIRELVPESATIWHVASDDPWHINYMLYPRVLRRGSHLREDIEKVRQEHPEDWVLTHETNNPQRDHARVFPPVNQQSKQ